VAPTARGSVVTANYRSSTQLLAPTARASVVTADYR